MGQSSGDRLQLTAARAGLLDGVFDDRDSGPDGVPRHVVASWRRSMSSGVAPGLVEGRYYEDLDLGSRLVRCARPVIEHLAGQIADVPMSVALTDNQARVLARRDSNPWIGRLLDRVCFAQGFGYAEKSVGTNGVGTALEFGESVHIVGAEHFVDVLQPFACTGAPVRDPFTGRFEGVLDLSCLAEHSTPLMHSLVRVAAAQIEHNLLLDRNQLQQALFDAYTRAGSRSRDAVLAVGPDTVITNGAAQALLAATDRESLYDHIRFIMQRHATLDERTELPSGRRVRLRGSVIGVGTGTAGMIAVVSPEAHTTARTAPGRPLPTPERPCLLAASTSTDWRAAADTVSTALGAGEPVLVLGEPGAGRVTLLRELATAHGPVTVLTPGEVDARPGEVLRQLLTRSRGVTILRDIDQLSRAAADTLVAGILDHETGLLAATARDVAHAADGAARVLGVFRASALVPPLRHRTADLPALVAAVLTDLAPHGEVHVSADAMRLLAAHPWPGNVAELRDALEHAVRRRPVGCIETGDLPAHCQSTPRSSLRPVDRAERDAIVAALREAGGNRVAAASALGLARSTLYRKIRIYGITL